jgi:hypothetical protein
MCHICDKARTQSLEDALKTVAQALQQRSNRDSVCLDSLVGELMGAEPTGRDALDCETVQLGDRI